MMTLEAPRRLAGKAGTIEQVTDAEAWRAVGLSRAGLSRFLRTAQTAVGLRGEVEVLLADDRTLRRLNRRFRGKDKATDVLSFPGYDFAGGPEEFAGGHAGDLAISLETAARQAKEHGHALRDEVRVLLLHGLLHLAGMDHEIDQGEMAEREALLRAKLRLPNGLIERVEGRANTATKTTTRAATKAVKKDAKKDAKKDVRKDVKKSAKKRREGRAERGRGLSGVGR